MLRAAAAELLLGRSWIRHDFLAYVFRWSKIAPLLDPGLSILVSALGLFLRKGGSIHESTPLLEIARLMKSENCGSLGQK